MTKQVKIIGLSINQDFGGLKASNLKFNDKNRLILIKGGVGSGKTTLNKAIRLTTQGSSVLQDKELYGEVDITAKLKDGDTEIFIECKSLKDGSLGYVLYTIKDGKKIKDVVIDGQKLTPAGYLKNLQTSLTWRLDELTSENPTTQRNILLDLYRDELEKVGVIYDKNHPKYVGNIIDKIEKAKAARTHKDALRKEVGGIADDLTKKGIDYEERRELKPTDLLEKAVNKIQAKISLAEEDIEQTKTNKLNELKAKGSQISINLHLLNDQIKEDNKKSSARVLLFKDLNELLKRFDMNPNADKMVVDLIKKNIKNLPEIKKELKFSKKGRCKSKPKYFNGDLKNLLKKYRSISSKYNLILDSDPEAASLELEKDLKKAKEKYEDIITYNNEADSINSFHEWRDADEDVRATKTKYYKKLISIDTGVKGLFIKGIEDDIFLVYNGSYDKKYFNNPKKELRKLSSYSGTQRPMICLLVQQYLLSKKHKTLPYLFIDDVPFDNKTIKLIEKMAKDLGLWLFVNWTGDFTSKGLKKGEVLVEGGELFFKK